MLSELSLESSWCGFDGTGKKVSKKSVRAQGQVGCDLFIPANATVEFQSKFNLQVSLV